MARSKKEGGASFGTAGARKPVTARRRKSFILDQNLIDEARAALGTKTDTETVEQALAMASFGAELVAGTRSVLGVAWTDPHGEEEPIPGRH